MGNTNFYKQPEFTAKYQKLQRQFKSQVPLYDVDRIKFPLSTSGMKIVDSTGKRVKLAGGNWSGGHAQRHCVGDNVIEYDLIKANPQLHGKTAMQIFDITIQKITKAGLMVILNNHTSKSQWCCSASDKDGLWYNQQWPQQKFFQCLKAMARRYRHNPRVIGMDLRNQIRRSDLKIPTWGTGDKATDWQMAAEKIGNQIQDIAPHWLIIVGGIDYQLDLSNVWKKPIKLHIPNKLVYSGHFYGFSWVFGMWDVRTQDSFRQKLFNDQLYVRGLDNGVPFLMGQFGGNQKDIPWNYLMNLYKQYDIDWCYWCLDGYKCHDKQDQTYGVWTRFFDDVRHPQMLKDMKKVGRPIQGITITK